MKKHILLLFFLGAIFLTGCKTAPEASSDSEILRAKGDSEDAIEAIVKDEEEDEGKGSTGSRTAELILGSGGNRMKIQAEIPSVPETLSILTMQADSSLNKEILIQFLDPQNETQDITQKLLDEMEAEIQKQHEIDKKLGEGDSIIETATIGDGNYLAFTDGNRTAVLNGRTGGTFEDASLGEKCAQAAKKNEKELDVKDPAAGDPTFSLQKAKELLKEKLSVLGIEDICLVEAESCEAGGIFYYEVDFVPVIEGLSIASSFGQMNIEDIRPTGQAIICEEGIARISLWDFCMEQAAIPEENHIISWNKVQQILKTYLENGTLPCSEEVPFTTVELVYYPKAKGDKLELIPAWNLHADIWEYMEYTGNRGTDTIWNIYINGITGELEEVQ